MDCEGGGGGGDVTMKGFLIRAAQVVFCLISPHVCPSCVLLSCVLSSLSCVLSSPVCPVFSIKCPITVIPSPLYQNNLSHVSFLSSTPIAIFQCQFRVACLVVWRDMCPSMSCPPVFRVGSTGLCFSVTCCGSYHPCFYIT